MVRALIWRKISVMKATPAVVAVFILLLLAPPCASGLDGYLDLAGSRTDTDGQRRESLRQEYNLTWSHDLAPYVDLRAGVRYYRFNQDVDLALSTYQAEFQPMAELMWRHPLFAFSSSARRRYAEATATSGNITSDNVLLSFKTRDQRYPLLGVRYDWQHVYDTIDGLDRDVRDESLQLTADYLAGNDILNYTFTSRNTENVVSDLQSRRTEHRGRWYHADAGLADGKLSFLVSYDVSYAEQTDRLLAGEAVLDPITAAAGLYARDESPDLGELTPVPGLTDGNTTAPTTPAIDIGGAQISQNIGVDLGFPRPITWLYLYTDGLSGNQPTWRVFVSSDNLDWEPAMFAGPITFNAALDRYEFPLGGIESRYVKLVKDGLNEVLDVMVTEVVALQTITIDSERTRISRTHNAAGRLSYAASKRVGASFDGSLGHDTSAGPTGDRTSLDYSVRSHWLMTSALAHRWRWTQSVTRLDDAADQRNDVASYTLVVEPRASLAASLGAQRRWSYLDQLEDQRQQSYFLAIDGQPVPRLRTSLTSSWNRIEQRRDGSINDVTSWGGRLDGQLTGTLDLNATYRYQDFADRDEGTGRVRRMVDIGFAWRASRTIFLRGRLAATRESTSTVSHDYLLSWRPAPRIVVTGQLYLDTIDGRQQSRRLAASATYELGRRSNLNLRWNEIDLSDAGGTFTETVQLALRIGI